LANDDRAAALLLAPEAPYPLAGGGSLRTASLLEYLGRNCALDLIVFRQPGAAEPASLLPAGLVRQVTVIPLPATRRGAAARAVRNAVRLARGVPPLVDRFAGFERQVERVVAGRSYAIGVIEHSWCAPYLDQIGGACRRTVLDLHNVESVLHARCAQVEGGAVGLAAVVPLLTGSGTRLKILEAWAAGLPVVSTTIGAEGLPVRDGENALLADGAEAFAGAVTRLLTCRELRRSIGSAGRLLLEKEFTWETAWKKLDF
jgi:hypothetical protein